jgi:hypothetical protein
MVLWKQWESYWSLAVSLPISTNLSGLEFLLLKASCLNFLGIYSEWVGGKFCPFLSNFIMNFFIFFHSLKVDLSPFHKSLGWKERQHWLMMTREISTPQSGKRDACRIQSLMIIHIPFPNFLKFVYFIGLRSGQRL